MRVIKNVSLSKHNTFKIRGKASFFVEIKSIDELKNAIDFAKEKKLRFFILGEGSNILFPENLPKRVIIKVSLKGLDFNGREVRVGAGENWDSFVLKSLNKNLYGLENLSAIPGSVGASPVQNIGAYGVEVSKFIKEVEVLDLRNLKIKNLSNKACGFGYRDSFFKTKEGKNFVITSVTFSLNKKDNPDILYKDLKNYFKDKKKPNAKEVRRAVIIIRRKKFPNLKKTGTAGSFFKNPIITKSHYNKLLKKYPNLPGFELENKKIKVPLAFILDKILGLKGLQIKNVALYKKQPLVFVNLNKAKQSDVLKLKKVIEKKVFNKTKIKIYPEVNIVK